MNHCGMIGADGITTCNQCLSYLNKIGAGAEKECYDCFHSDERGKPQINIIDYLDLGIDTPAFKDLQEQINQLKAKLHLYFEEKKSVGF